tara:strand:+ start:290 stop:1177 length:888 start_codon:yes stop_codon:yes gene_type:complete
MKDEIADNLITDKSGIYIDCTLGFGGHSKALFEKLNKDALVIGLDCDIDAYSYSKDEFIDNSRIKVFNSNYMDYCSVLNELKIEEVDGVLMDLGISSYQIDSEGRGFSYRYNSELDMRFDINYKKTARDILNHYNVHQIASIIKDYGEEKNYKNIAKNIVKYSKKGKMNTTYDLKSAIIEATNYKANMNKIFSRVFQAVRIEVNSEFKNIKKMINSLPYKVKLGGRILWLTFHSLEDRLVKRSTFALNGQIITTDYGDKKIALLSKKIIKPSRKEILENRRSRSAKLRGLVITEC